jgi:hypothetical protein
MQPEDRDPRHHTQYMQHRLQETRALLMSWQERNYRLVTASLLRASSRSLFRVTSLPIEDIQTQRPFEIVRQEGTLLTRALRNSFNTTSQYGLNLPTRASHIELEQHRLMI